MGDSLAKLVIVSLAPVAHGANRTGTMFNHSGQWLMKSLFTTEYANILSSNHKYDGLLLTNEYVTSVLRSALH